MIQSASRSRWRLLPFILGGGCLVVENAGLVALFSYQTSPGQTAHPPEYWPAGSRIVPSTRTPTLLMVMHPHCPCSRASIGELNLIMARCGKSVDAHALFIKPARFQNGWEQTDLWTSAERIPGVNVHCDENGDESRRFHAATSGQTLLYDAKGRLIFSGGITGGRGHSGDNAGRSALVALLTGGNATSRQTPVYGCSLFKSSATLNEKKICCSK